MSERSMRKVHDYLWEVPRSGKMRVPARIYATQPMLEKIVADRSQEQAANVAELPGIVTASLAMPDIQGKLTGLGFELADTANENFPHIVADELKQWAKVVKATNIKIE